MMKFILPLSILLLCGCDRHPSWDKYVMENGCKVVEIDQYTEGMEYRNNISGDYRQIPTIKPLLKWICNDGTYYRLQ